jgi:ElaB/YqjD/DUF883 family membrane-anchored ribosome-binding protein
LAASRFLRFLPFHIQPKGITMTPNTSLDRSSTVGDVANVAASALDHAGEQASHMASSYAKRGADALREGSHQLQDKAAHLQERAQRASDSTVTYIKEEPVKAMLMAAATGAVLMGLIGLMSRLGHRNT